MRRTGIMMFADDLYLCTGDLVEISRADQDRWNLRFHRDGWERVIAVSTKFKDDLVKHVQGMSDDPG